eukprot:2359851-Pleurochrysis_carterae.AAC.1
MQSGSTGKKATAVESIRDKRGMKRWLKQPWSTCAVCAFGSAISRPSRTHLLLKSSDEALSVSSVEIAFGVRCGFVGDSNLVCVLHGSKNVSEARAAELKPCPQLTRLALTFCRSKC